MNEVKFEIIQPLGVLSETSSGWKREINLVSWNGADPKFDIREWDPNHERMSKGIALNAEEVAKLREILDRIDNK